MTLRCGAVKQLQSAEAAVGREACLPASSCSSALMRALCSRMVASAWPGTSRTEVLSPPGAAAAAEGLAALCTDPVAPRAESGRALPPLLLGLWTELALAPDERSLCRHNGESVMKPRRVICY